MNRKFIAFIMLLCLALSCETASAKTKKRKASPSPQQVSSLPDSVLPKRGDIAIIVEGDDDQHVRLAETRIIDSLIQHGYRVVDEKKMKAAKLAAAKAQAYRLAMQGNYNAIFKINTSYNVAATVMARVQAGQAWQNSMGTFTGTASVSVLALTSNGTRLGGKTASSKKFGGSEYEALMNSVIAAVDEGMKQMY